jgi:hypothetical protein
MPDPITMMAAQKGIEAAGGAVNAGMGMLLGAYNDKRQLKQQDKLLKQQEGYNRNAAQFSHDLQMDMWNKTNYGAQMEHMKKAGLSPGLMYGMSGGGGTTAGSVSQSAPQSGGAPAGGGEAMAMMQMGMQNQMLQAQKDLIKAQTKKTEAEAENEAGANRANTVADTELKTLQSVVQKYLGKEAGEQFTIKQNARGIEAKTYEDEMAARQGVAGTIYELWFEGKLKEKSLHEIEGLALGNAVTKEQRRKVVAEIDLLEAKLKGQNIENIIMDLEAKLQTQTGLDRSSPGWMKVLGRLFVGLFGGIDGVTKQ